MRIWKLDYIGVWGHIQVWGKWEMRRKGESECGNVSSSSSQMLLIALDVVVFCDESGSIHQPLSWGHKCLKVVVSRLLNVVNMSTTYLPLTFFQGTVGDLLISHKPDMLLTNQKEFYLVMFQSPRASFHYENISQPLMRKERHECIHLIICVTFSTTFSTE